MAFNVCLKSYTRILPSSRPRHIIPFAAITVGVDNAAFPSTLEAFCEAFENNWFVIECNSDHLKTSRCDDRLGSWARPLDEVPRRFDIEELRDMDENREGEGDAASNIWDGDEECSRENDNSGGWDRSRETVGWRKDWRVLGERNINPGDPLPDGGVIGIEEVEGELLDSISSGYSNCSWKWFKLCR